jgi:hypothetical protein
MGETRIAGGNIANCERVKLVTIEDAPRTFVMESATGVSFTGVVSAGAEQEMRIKNTICGVLRTEDILRGYDITLDDPALNTRIYALIDGGSLTGEPGASGEKYAAPAAGAPTERTAFDLYVYSSDRDVDGEAVCYHQWRFPSCKGRPVEGALKDGEFSVVSYKIASRPAAGASPLTMERVAALPEA